MGVPRISRCVAKMCRALLSYARFGRKSGSRRNNSAVTQPRDHKSKSSPKRRLPNNMSGGRYWLVQLCTLSSVGRCFHWMRSSCHFKSAQPRRPRVSNRHAVKRMPCCQHSFLCTVLRTPRPTSMLCQAMVLRAMCVKYHVPNTRNHRASYYKQYKHSNGAF